MCGLLKWHKPEMQDQTHTQRDTSTCTEKMKIVVMVLKMPSFSQTTLFFTIFLHACPLLYKTGQLVSAFFYCIAQALQLPSSLLKLETNIFHWDICLWGDGGTAKLSSCLTVLQSPFKVSAKPTASVSVGEWFGHFPVGGWACLLVWRLCVDLQREFASGEAELDFTKTIMFCVGFFSVWDECKPWQYRTTSSLFSWWTFSPFSQWAMWRWKKYVYVRIDIRSSAQVDSRDPLLLFHSTCFCWHDIGWLRISQHSSLDDLGRKSKLWIWWSKEHEELHFRAG